MTIMEKAMNKTIEDLENKLKADNIKPCIRKALEAKVKLLKGDKIVVK